ncbi:MAG: T9SS type A sorting domain-containing protein [Ignavibacteriales bacterium]|nr:T9SS type A sorting domain-containing protein [Ignavibacteriales bacterium]
MKYCLPFVLFILFNSNIIGGTVPRHCPIHHTSGRGSDSLNNESVTLTLPTPLYRNDQISLTLECDTYIELRLYNILGQLVTVFADGNYSTGIYHFYLSDGDYSSGVYFLALKTMDARDIKKIIYLR